MMGQVGVSGMQSFTFTLLTWQKEVHPLPFKPFCILKMNYSRLFPDQ